MKQNLDISIEIAAEMKVVDPFENRIFQKRKRGIPIT